MPPLDWIGKQAVLNHHNAIPFHLLRCKPELSLGEDSPNLLVQGDNLLALKALLPYYAGQVKCIYIDPPYNTGEESWTYNDNVNSPEIKQWLGEVVGREGEDFSRHDKWLCMMYPRLAILKEFLREDGVIFISIDEYEVANLRILLSEIFGVKNDMGSMVWKRRSSSAMSGMPLSIDHEYILAFAKNSTKVKLYGLAKNIDMYSYRDEKGAYASTDLTVGMGKEARPGQFYTIKNPRTGKEYPPNPERVWRFYPDTMQKIIEADLIIWPDEQIGNIQRPRYKTYFDPENLKPKPISSWIATSSTNDRDINEDEIEFDVSILSTGMNQEGGKLLQKMFGNKSFAYPKPLSLVRSLVRAATRDNDIVMDSFAGSGTTGHAVFDLNGEDNQKRRFILVEIDPNIAQSITAERLRRVIQGYDWKDQKGNTRHEEGLGGGFRFCELGPTLFDKYGQIRPEVSFSDLARHVFFTETGSPGRRLVWQRAPYWGAPTGWRSICSTMGSCKTPAIP
jgi:site-specific DNA-methyltransferase (adenine-specific)/adenine-specific DNA-methyltransferase